MWKTALAPALLSEVTAPKDGCWLNGKWYPEGAKVYPPPNSRIAAPGYSLCKNGKWTYVTTY